MSNIISINIEDGVAVIHLDNPPVNALSAAVRDGLSNAASEISARTDVSAVVLIGEGRCFCAGADVSEFGTEPPAGTPTLPEAIAAIENLEIPVIAAIHGFALGGGLEVSLGAHYRVATAETLIGLPEVDLGIIPGAGGTQRLPRLTGVSVAAELVSSGKKIGAKDAHGFGIIDEIVEGDLRQAAIDFAKSLLANGEGARPTSMRSDKIEDPTEAGKIMSDVRDKVANKTKGRRAPLRALDSVQNATLPFDEGIAAERAIFLDLRDGPEARALRHLFKAERAAAKIDDAPEGFRPTEIKTAGVIGLGTMGQGIALVLSRAGIEVIAVEVDEDRLTAGLDALTQGLQDRVDRGRMSTEVMDEELSRISGTSEMGDLADCDLVIEAAIEDMKIKRSIFAQLNETCRADAILTTNTSSLDIDKIADAVDYPNRVAGAHFFAPAQVMKLLELVRGPRTSAETMASLMALSKRAKKVGVSVGNAFGFVANRMYHRYTWQAYFMLQEGAMPHDVDTAMQEFGFPLGCLAVGDMSGLDVAWKVRQAQKEIGDIPDDMPYPIVADRICEKGWLGRKTGRGWYTYETKKPEPYPEVEELIISVSEELGIMRRDVSTTEVQDRCLYALINEGIRLLGQGIATRPGDIDIIWRYGYGFPNWRGGPMFIAEDQGLSMTLDKMRELHAAHGKPFEPAPLLVERVGAGKTTLVD